MTNLSFSVFWRDHGAQKGLTDLGKQADRTHTSFGRFTDRAGSGLSKLGGAALKFGAVGAVALAGVGAAGIGMGLKVASGNEQAKISFTTMLGSAKKADAFLRQLQSFAARTPFEFPELQKSASQLIAIGINAKDVIPIMTSLGNITSGMGTGSEGIKRAVVAIQQMNAAGRIQAQDLNQLRDAGVPVYELLAKATGKSAQQIALMAQKGKLGRRELDQLMASLKSGNGLERFSGLMEKQSHSLAGMVSTLKDTFGQGLANAIAPSFPLIKQGLESVSASAAKFFGWIGKNQGSIATVFRVAGSTLHTFGEIASTVFGSLTGSLGDGRKSFKSFADYLESHQEDITRALVTGGKGALQLGKSLATGSAAGLRAFGFMVDGMATGTEGILTMFGNIAQGSLAVWGWIPGIGPKLAEANAKFQAFGASAVSGMRGAASGARGAADAIDKKIVPALDKAQGGLDKIGKTEFIKARMRDQAAKVSQLIAEMGNNANGTQIKLKKWSDRLGLSSHQQELLDKRIHGVQRALSDQMATMRQAGVGQDKLSRAWEIGRDRLYKEFRQMGLSRAEAKRLADRYAAIPPKRSTTFSQPGMAEAQRRAKDLNGRVRDIPTRWNTTANLTFKNNAGRIVANLNKQFQLVKGGPKMMFAGGGVMPGYTPGRDVHQFWSPTGGSLALSGGEAIMRPEWTRAVGGPAAVARMNKAARSGQAFAGGGVFGAYEGAGLAANSREGTSGSQMYGWAVKKKLEGAMAYAQKYGGGADGLGNPANVSNPRGVASYHGGRFTRLFIANLRAAERDAGRAFSIYQGGFRPTTSYSGSTHNMDAVDARVDYALLRAFRKHVGAMGDRTGLGNWASHMHGVPAPGHGYGSPSARAQYRDYLRRGGARQSFRSPWGLGGGGVMVDPSTVNVSERAPERVLTPRQTRAFEDLVRAVSSSGGAPSVNVYIDAPNLIGGVKELEAGMLKSARSGGLKKVLREAGVTV